MNRRGILGAIMGAPIAGPAVVSDVAQQMALNAAPSVGYASGVIGSVGEAAGRWMEPDDALRKAFRLGLVSREKLAELIAGMRIGDDSLAGYRLDADLQMAKSFSLSARIRMQRERNTDREITRFLAKPKSFWDYGRELVEKGLVSHDD